MSHKNSLAPFVLLLISSQAIFTDGANILFFIGFGGLSHRISMEPLASALVSRGHNVTFLSSHPGPKDSKINYYNPALNYERMQSFYKGGFDFYKMRDSPISKVRSFILPSIGAQVCENLFKDPEYLKWISDNKFDLIFIDGLINECAYGIAHIHKAKTILFSVSTILPMAIDGIGVPDETSYIPHPFYGFREDLGFVQRIWGALLPVLMKAVRHFYYFPKMTRIVREATGDESFPYFGDLERNTSLMFVNTHPSQEYPRSLPPNIIPVGGISMVEGKEGKAVPKKFEDFINSGKDGFIYISFGSFIDFLKFPEHVQNKFINTLKRFPNIQFIWKLNKVPENLPKNILVEKWLPQQDLLSHPKIRTFITHGGLGGVNEAIYSKVPLILFPVLAEQDYNAYLAERRGFGIKMEITDLKVDDLEQAILEILSNPSYKENIGIVNSQFLDRPMSPLDSAVWWTEYVLRQDTSFLRPHNVDQSWWVKRQIDVWIFLFSTIILMNVISFYVGCKLLGKCCSKKQGKKLKKN